ncbi:MAG: TSUP family transporter [Endozoicomonas sp.]
MIPNESGDRVRGNLAAFFIVCNCVSLAVLSVIGLFDIPRLLSGLALFPAVLCGDWVAGRIVSRGDRETIRRVLLVLCCLSGLTAIFPPGMVDSGG